ncbi:hypothetical protein LTR50_003548 [Elasticomyces elasticus]|nr:hypothetical protein LTR50_003548 [Elasticomyces elasticus]
MQEDGGYTRAGVASMLKLLNGRPNSSPEPYKRVNLVSLTNPPESPEVELAIYAYRNPKFNVSAKRWTNVTDDDALVSYLLAGYFQHQHPFFCWFDEHLFINDLIHGKTDFCSPVLVNAVLASACTTAHLVLFRSTPYSDEFLGKLFWDEARARLAKEERAECLVITQSLMTVAYYANCVGLDKIGTFYLDRAIRLAKNLGLFRDPSRWKFSSLSQSAADKTRESRAVTAWGIFNYQMQCVLQRETYIHSPPLVAIPYADTSGWKQNLFRLHSKLSRVQNDVCAALYPSEEAEGSDIRVTTQQSEALYVRLQTWRDIASNSYTDEAMATRCELALLEHYDTIVIVLFNKFTKVEDLAPWETFYRTRARSIVKERVQHLRHVAEIKLAQRGYRTDIGYNLQFLLVSSFASLTELAPGATVTPAEAADAYKALTTSIMAMLDLSVSHMPTQAGLQVVRDTAARLNIILGSELQAMLDTFNSNQWKRNASRHFHSAYPTDPLGVTVDTETARLDNVVKMWDAMALGDGEFAGDTDGEVMSDGHES